MSNKELITEAIEVIRDVLAVWYLMPRCSDPDCRPCKETKALADRMKKIVVKAEEKKEG